MKHIKSYDQFLNEADSAKEIEKKINKKIDASMMGELISIKLIVDHLKKMNAIS